MTTRRTPLAKATPQQRRVLEAWYRYGTLKAAAHELEISEQTAKNHMAKLYARTGARSSGDVFYWLGVEINGRGTLVTDSVPST